MPIKFYLQPNPITPDPNDQSARVATNVTLSSDDIVKKALLRGTTLTETDLRAVMTLLFNVIGDEIADGNAVTLPLVNIRPSITGVFSSATDSFDDSRHVKRASLSAGVLLTQKMQGAKVEKIPSSQPAPDLQEYMNINTGTANSILTPGGIGQLTGSELKFDPSNLEEGIYLVHETGTETKITVLATRTEGRLVFSIPGGLATGGYRLEVRRGYGNAGAIRTGALNELLQVS
jgi:hypothetical protein